MSIAAMVGSAIGSVFGARESTPQAVAEKVVGLQRERAGLDAGLASLREQEHKLRCDSVLYGEDRTADLQAVLAQIEGQEHAIGEVEANLTAAQRALTLSAKREYAAKMEELDAQVARKEAREAEVCRDACTHLAEFARCLAELDYMEVLPPAQQEAPVPLLSFLANVLNEWRFHSTNTGANKVSRIAHEDLTRKARLRVQGLEVQIVARKEAWQKLHNERVVLKQRGAEGIAHTALEQAAAK